ncbi:unnamed protein product [Ilex paraguariensis]|uniref:Uncharacterized protein n=1 Tax=Ilex paraguariensis TaxID=185542 RepID=A0ABC8TW57_9AQUA
MAATRLPRMSRPLGLGAPSSFSCSCNSSISSSTMNMMRLNKVGFNGENTITENGETKAMAALKASVADSDRVVTSKPQTEGGVDLTSVLENVKAVVRKSFKVLVTKGRPWKLRAQLLIEKVIIDCRFFTLFAVAGSLIGSVLCFVEGSFIILESYLQYFHALSEISDQAHVVQLLIEAIDMFLVGTALFLFGIALHVMFVGPKNLKGKGSQLPGSNLFGLFYLKTLPSWVGMQSVTQAKSNIGHAMMMILQVGILEKFKSTPLVTGLDLACFAGSVFLSSASIFLLSRLTVSGRKWNCSR